MSINSDDKKKRRKMQTVDELLRQKIAEMGSPETGKKRQARNVTQEFQDYGLRLAHRLNDFKHKALYIKFAAKVPRALVEDAAAFATDYPQAKNKGKLFMWKLHELIAEYNLDHPDKQIKLGRSKKAGKQTAKKESNKEETTPSRKVQTDNLPLL